MEYSTNFNFTLPSRDNDVDLADINEISNNFRKVDEKAVIKEVGKGLSTNDFTNEEKEKLANALLPENIDQTYSATSTNAQSGTAVAEALKTIVKDLEPVPMGTVDKWEYNKLYKNVTPVALKIHQYVFNDGTSQTMGELLPISIVVKSKENIVDSTHGSYERDIVYNFDGQNVREWTIDQKYKTIVLREFVPTTEISETATNNQYPTALAVKNYISNSIDKTYSATSENAQSGMAVAEAMNNVANAIKQTVIGNQIVIDDASPIKHTLDVKTSANETVYVRGKNLIPFNNKAYYNGKYTAGQTYVINGVSFTVNDDGSVYARGTATGTITFTLFSGGSFETGVHTATLSGSPNGSSATTYSLRLRNAEATSGVYSDYGSGVTVNNTSITKATVAIIVINGATVDATFYPMLEFGTTASKFIPPEETQSAIADENGIVSGIKLRKITSIFTETSAEIKCTYNKDTEKAIKDYVDTVIGGIENGSY